MHQTIDICVESSEVVPPAPALSSNQGFSTAQAINHILEVMPSDIRRELTTWPDTEPIETPVLAPPSDRRVSPLPPPPAPMRPARPPPASSSNQGPSTAQAINHMPSENQRDLATCSETEPETDEEIPPPTPMRPVRPPPASSSNQGPSTAQAINHMPSDNQKDLATWSETEPETDEEIPTMHKQLVRASFSFLPRCFIHT